MSIAHLLEDFGPSPEALLMQSMQTPGEAAETVRLEAYEEGYRAGWDDAVAANQSERLQLAADLTQNLRDMSFTYQEACTHVIGTLNGILEGMLSVFLPEAARVALIPKVIEEIGKLPLSADDMRLVLSVSPENIAVMEHLNDKIDGAEISLKEDQTLAAGQVIIGFQDTEVSVDFDALLDDMRRAIESFQNDNLKDVNHG